MVSIVGNPMSFYGVTNHELSKRREFKAGIRDSNWLVIMRRKTMM
ncbi:MAG: hypothetical protein A4E63_00589 [Syntrophorhabdus sp. PtaU1.Bin050]|nr:MAG: hypothetical protein A4E63_00589 [Syntrophorhabdus sp. PtaU1.Bin050]